MITWVVSSFFAFVFQAKASKKKATFKASRTTKFIHSSVHSFIESNQIRSDQIRSRNHSCRLRLRPRPYTTRPVKPAYGVKRKAQSTSLLPPC